MRPTTMTEFLIKEAQMMTLKMKCQLGLKYAHKSKK